MKRVLLIVEGHTEQQFVKKILQPFLNAKGLYSVDCFKIKHSRGGLNKYKHLKTDIMNCIFQTDIVISTLIDFYALPSDFPGYEYAKKAITNKVDRVTFIENSIRDDLENEKRQEFPNFVPYIQLHEFEALIFSSDVWVSSLFTKEELDVPKINNIFSAHPNPEDINDSPMTAPSKRLAVHIKGYEKVIDGIMILETIGIEIIMEKCPRFRGWVNTLITKANEL